MARTGDTPPAEGEGLETASTAAPLVLDTAKRTTKEEEVDYMKGAGPERPYGDAVSDVHRQLLTESGVIVPKASKESGQE